MKFRLLLTLFVFLFTSSLCFAQTRKCQLDIKDSPALRGIKLGTKRIEIKRLFGNHLTIVKGRSPVMVTNDPSTDVNGLSFLLNDKDSGAKKVLDLYKYVEDYNPFSSSGSLDRSLFLYVPNELVGAFSKVSLFSGDLAERFKDVKRVSFGFFNNEVISIGFNYKTNAFYDATNEEAYSEILTLLGIPGSTSSPGGEIQCKNFSVSISITKEEINILLLNSVIDKAFEKKAVQTVKETYERFKKEKAASKRFKP